MFGNQIAGNILAKGKKTFQSFDPKNNCPNTSYFFVATEEEIDLALTQSSKSFYSFCSASPAERAFLLEQIAEQLIELRSEISQAFCKESGLSLSRFETEFKRTVDQLLLFASYLKNPKVDFISETRANQASSLPHLLKKKIPLGPVLVFGASNFPLAYSTIGGDTVSAFAAGCPVVVKAHPFHPETSFLVGKAIKSAIDNTNFPQGIFSQLFDDHFDVGQKLALDNRIKAIGFTGSYTGGKALFDLANSRQIPIPVFAEMGSINPVFIFPESLKNQSEFWAQHFAKSISNDAGQFCTKPGLFFIPNTENGKIFISILKNKLVQEPSFTMLHPTIYNRYEIKKEQLRNLSNGEFIEKKGSLSQLEGRQGLLTIDKDEFLQIELLKEEIFGPFAIICFYDSHDELLTYIKELQGQLTSTIIATQEEIINNESVMFNIKQLAGRIIFNGVPTGVRVCESMQHGGPFPASTDARFTAVGTESMLRFMRPIVYQDNC